MDGLDGDLGRLLTEARRVAGPDLVGRIHAKDGATSIVFEIVADDAVVATRLAAALEAFCDREGLPRRYLVVRSEPVRFRRGPRVPDRWPAEDPPR